MLCYNFFYSGFVKWPFLSDLMKLLLDMDFWMDTKFM